DPTPLVEPEAQPVVEPVGLPLPELHRAGLDEVAPPLRCPRDRPREAPLAPAPPIPDPPRRATPRARTHAPPAAAPPPGPSANHRSSCSCHVGARSASNRNRREVP